MVNNIKALKILVDDKNFSDNFLIPFPPRDSRFNVPLALPRHVLQYEGGRRRRVKNVHHDEGITWTREEGVS